MKSNITKKPAVTVTVERSVMEKLQDRYEVATRMCDGEEAYLDVSVLDSDEIVNIAQIVGCEAQDIQGQLIVLSVINK
jgi:hypothetical protein